MCFEDMNLGKYLGERIENILNGKDFKMSGRYEFHFATEIIYGRDSSLRVGELARRLGLKKVQVITDKGLVKAGTAKKILCLLKDNGIQSVRYISLSELKPIRMAGWSLVNEALLFASANY